MKHDLVKNWMSTTPITITTTTTLPEAYEIMKSAKIRRLPVLDGGGALVGIVTLGDIRGAQASSATSLSIWELNNLLAELKVKRFMTQNPVTIADDATIGTAALTMIKHKISGLPVLKDGELVGIITESDIFNMIVIHEWAEGEDDMDSVLRAVHDN